METSKLIESLMACADSILSDKGRCDRSKCPVALQTDRKDFPYCCAETWKEAAYRLEELDERIAIMTECKEDANGEFNYGSQSEG